jgi:CHAT domain-containing protein
LRGTLAQEALRTSFLQDKTVAYEELMLLHLERGDAASIRQAFAVAEQAKSRTLVDLLAGVIESSASSSSDSERGTHLQQLQADLHAIYNQFLGTGELADALSISELHQRAIHLEQQIRQLQLKEVGHVQGGDEMTARLPTETLQQELPADLTTLAYHIVGDEILAFVHRGETIQVVRHLSRATVIQQLLQRLNVQWNRFRAGQRFAQRHMAQLEQSTRRVLADLYRELLRPVVPLLPEAAVGATPPKLLVVPHGVLHQVPFHALHDGQQYWIDAYELSYAPSVTVFNLCQQRTRRGPHSGLVVGVPDDLIPSVTAEAEVVTQQLRAAQVETASLVETSATLHALREKAVRCDILHIACHGLFRADNPMFSALKLYDGWLTAADVMQLDLAGSLVTLSACESGRGQVLLGDEVIGLPRAFLGAGSATLVVSLWLAEDETTAALMAEWYAQLGQNIEPVAALRAAQLAVKALHLHPYFWAPFVLMGKR